MTNRLSDEDQTGWPTVRRLYTVQQAADVAEASVEEICYWVRMGRLKVSHLGCGRVRIDEADLLASIEPGSWSGDRFLAGDSGKPGDARATD